MCAWTWCYSPHSDQLTFVICLLIFKFGPRQWKPDHVLGECRTDGPATVPLWGAHANRGPLVADSMRQLPGQKKGDDGNTIKPQAPPGKRFKYQYDDR